MLPFLAYIQIIMQNCMVFQSYLILVCFAIKFLSKEELVAEACAHVHIDNEHDLANLPTQWSHAVV